SDRLGVRRCGPRCRSRRRNRGGVWSPGACGQPAGLVGAHCRAAPSTRGGGPQAKLAAVVRPTGTSMTLRTESRLTITSSVSDVWTYVCDVERWPEWAPTVLECWVRGGDALQVGARVDQRAKGILGSTRERSQQVTAVDAPGRVAFAGPMGTSA